jgi:hypothetical protein
MHTISNAQIEQVLSVLRIQWSAAIPDGEPEINAAKNMLQGLLAQPAQPDQQAKLFLRVRAQLEQEWGVLKKLKEAYTHPAPFTPITADDVTNEVVISVCSTINRRAGGWGTVNPKEIIVAAVNAWRE